MAAATAHRPAAPLADDLDDLFDYDVNVDDVFRDVDTNIHAPVRENTAVSRPKDSATGNTLGIDEEIKVVKKRVPVPKLDEGRYVNSLSERISGKVLKRLSRLLCRHGVSKLRRTAKERLRFKGKGHEVR